MREIEPKSGGAFLEGYALYRLGKLTERDTIVAEGWRRRLQALDGATADNEAPARTLLAELGKK